MKTLLGITIRGTKYAAMDATLTLTNPSWACGKNASLTLTVPTALIFMISSAEPILGLTPAVWINDTTVPSEVALWINPATESRSVMSHRTTTASIASPRNASIAVLRRSALTSQITTGCSRTTIFAVASPIPPAPPVMTDTSVIEELPRLPPATQSEPIQLE